MGYYECTSEPGPPPVEDVARELELINANVEGECEVRLQVYDDGEWMMHYGDPGWDQDHRGYWGASSVPGVGGPDMQPREFDSKEMAEDLIDQVQEAYAWANTSSHRE